VLLQRYFRSPECGGILIAGGEILIEERCTLYKDDCINDIRGKSLLPKEKALSVAANLSECYINGRNFSDLKILVMFAGWSDAAS
jgi:hypothetical protein